jgi:hypothetical protein
MSTPLDADYLIEGIVMMILSPPWSSEGLASGHILWSLIAGPLDGAHDLRSLFGLGVVLRFMYCTVNVISVIPTFYLNSARHAFEKGTSDVSGWRQGYLQRPHA